MHCLVAWCLGGKRELLSNVEGKSKVDGDCDGVAVAADANVLPGRNAAQKDCVPRHLPGDEGELGGATAAAVTLDIGHGGVGVEVVIEGIGTG